MRITHKNGACSSLGSLSPMPGPIQERAPSCPGPEEPLQELCLRPACGGNRACISLRWENAPGLWPQNDLSSANTASRSQEDARLWRKQHGLLRTRSGMGREDDEYTHGRSNVNNIELPQMLQILRVVGFRVQTHQGVRGGVSELRS